MEWLEGGLARCGAGPRVDPTGLACDREAAARDGISLQFRGADQDRMRANRMTTAHRLNPPCGARVAAAAAPIGIIGGRGSQLKFCAGSASVRRVGRETSRGDRAARCLLHSARRREAAVCSPMVHDSWPSAGALRHVWWPAMTPGIPRRVDGGVTSRLPEARKKGRAGQQPARRRPGRRRRGCVRPLEMAMVWCRERMTTGSLAWRGMAPARGHDALREALHEARCASSAGNGALGAAAGVAGRA